MTGKAIGPLRAGAGSTILRAALLLSSVLLPAIGTACWAQETSADLNTCIMGLGDDPPSSVVHSCTAAIDSGHLSETNLRNALNNRGIAYKDIGDFRDAVADFSQALTIDPNYNEALNNRGAAYMVQGDYDRAIADYDKAIALNPDYFIARKNRGAAYVNKGDYKTALLDYDSAVKLEPERPDILQIRGILHFLLGDYEDSLADEKSAVENDPSDAYSAIWLYLAQRRNGMDGMMDLAANAANLKLSRWPGPVVELYLGKSKPDGLVALGKSDNPKYASDRECEAEFYLAERDLLDGKVANAKREFEAALSTGGTKTNFEYQGAQLELDRLGKSGGSAEGVPSRKPSSASQGTSSGNGAGT